MPVLHPLNTITYDSAVLVIGNKLPRASNLLLKASRNLLASKLVASMSASANKIPLLMGMHLNWKESTTLKSHNKKER